MPELPEVDPAVGFRVSSPSRERFYSTSQLSFIERLTANIRFPVELLFQAKLNNLESSLLGRNGGQINA